MPSVLLVGCGKQGSTYVDGWLKSGIDPKLIAGVVSSAKRAKELKARYPIEVYAGLDAVPAAVKPAVVMLATPGTAMDSVLAQCRRFVPQKSVFLTVVAAVNLAAHESGLGDGAAVARASSNVASLVARGCFGLFGGRWLGEREARLCDQVLAPIGTTVWLDREDHVDLATAISGCSLAYFIAMAEGLADAAIAAGLPAEKATRLVRAALAGAGECIHVRPDEPMPQFRLRLTNPGGSTEAGMNVLTRDSRLARLMAEVVDAILKRQADRWKPKK